MHEVKSDGSISQLPPTPEKYKKTYEVVQGTKTFIVESEAAIAELASQEQALIAGHIIIKPKKSIPNDIQKVDQET
jgi:hypothetical protein